MTDKLKILYVDDEKMNTQLFEINFSDLYHVITASDGIDGLKKLEDNDDIKFIISDMKMPKMNGLEFINKVKETRKKIPCLILSGYTLTKEIEEAINKGTIVEYMVKPFNAKKINDVIVKYNKG